MRLPAIVLVSVLAVSIAACGPTPVSSSSLGTLIAVPTQTPPLPAAGSPQACMAALLTGELVADRGWGVAVKGDDGRVVKVIWPYGYAARADGSGLVLVDTRHGNAVIAREGDRVEVGGGYAGSEEDGWLACADVAVVAPR